MTINFIHTLEAISIFLAFVMLFQVRKHYILFSEPKLKTTLKPKIATHKKTTAYSTFNEKSSNRPASKYYFPKLPELEVTVSSDQDIASFTNTPSIKSTINSKVATKHSIKRSVTKKKKAKQAPSASSTHKAILHNYIDDFFSETTPAEVQHPDILPYLDLQISSPAIDEIITVNEPTEMV